MYTFNKMIISVIQEYSCSESTGVDVPTSSKRPCTETPHRSSDDDPSTIHLIIVPNHQVQIWIVLNHQIKLVHIHLTMMDQYMISLYLVVDIEEAVDMEEAMDMDEFVDIEGMMDHIVPHHQVVIHHTEDMLGTAGVQGHLLE